MGVGLEDPVDREALRLHMGDDALCGIEDDPPRRRVEVHDAVDDRGPACYRIVHHVACRERLLVKEALHAGRPST